MHSKGFWTTLSCVLLLALAARAALNGPMHGTSYAAGSRGGIHATILHPDGLMPAGGHFAVGPNVGDSPRPAPPTTPIIAPENRPYPGVIRLSVDATDIRRRIFRVHETIPVTGGKEVVLFYPEWLPGTHAPEGRNRINRFAGLTIHANGSRVSWTRDTINVYAFHVIPPETATSLDVEFQYLSPVSQSTGNIEVSANILVLEWSSVLLYPAGYFTSQIPIDADVVLPAGWQFATALQQAPASDPGTFERISVETLVDSPLFAGRDFARFDLDPNAPTPVHLDLFADRPELLKITPEELAAHRRLIEQAYKLFSSKHYDHYDFLVTLSDNIPRFGGLEHHRSSQIDTYATYLTEWNKTVFFRDLLPHEYVHSMPIRLTHTAT